MITIDDHDITRLDPARRIVDPADDRNVEGARHNRHMGGRRALLEHQTHDPPACVVQQLGRSHRARDEDEFVRQFRPGRTQRPSRQVLLQPVGEVFEIEKTLAQIGVADLHHAGAGVVRDFLHRCLGGQAAADRIGDAHYPAAIGGKHAIGFDYVVMLAVAELTARRDQLVDRLAHRPDRATKTPELRIDVLGDDLADDDPGLVQHRRPDRHAGIQPNPDDPDRERYPAVTLRDFERVDEMAARRELGDDHRDRLQKLDLVFAVMAQCPVLHDENAEDPVAAQDRRTHQRMVDFFAGFGPIGKICMGLRVRQRERPRRCGDYPDQTLADPQPRPVHGFRPEPFGGEQLEDLARPQDVSRADLGDHLGGNDPHNLFEPLLGGT